jgi:hypothetical protein
VEPAACLPARGCSWRRLRHGARSFLRTRLRVRRIGRGGARAGAGGGGGKALWGWSEGGFGDWGEEAFDAR